MYQIRRLTIVTETFYPEINGVANTLVNLLKALHKQGIVVQVIHPKQTLGSDKIEIPIDDVIVPGLPIPGYSSLRFGLPCKKRITRAMKRFQSDALYIATEGPLGLSALRVAKQCNLPVLSGFHTNFHQYFEHYHLRFLKGIALSYLRAFHNACDKTLVPTRYLQNELSSQGFKRVDMMARGVDADLFSPLKRSFELRREWGVSASEPVLIYVGRIANEKNIHLALKGYEAFKLIQPQAKMVVVGDGPVKDNLEQAYPDVIFTGEKRGECLARHYASADIFVFPSLTDTFGNVVLEAMASGLHVIGFNYAAAGSLIDNGVNGSLAVFGSESDFIQELKFMALNFSGSRATGKAARLSSERVSWEQICRQFVKHLNTLNKEKANGLKQERVFIPKV